jgi:hypothetical protein
MRINAFLTYSPLEITIREDSLDIVARVPHARHRNETLLDIDVPLQEQSEGQHPNAQRNGSDRPNRKWPFPVCIVASSCIETYMTAKGQEITAIIQELSGHLLLSDVPMQSNIVTHVHRVLRMITSSAEHRYDI